MAYPSHWDQEIIEDVAAFYDPEGDGALQVAVASRSMATEPTRELEIYLQKQGMEYKADNVAVYDLPRGGRAAVCEFIKQERFWMVGMFTKNEKVLIVMYNADEVPDQETAGLISSTLNTIEFL